jgi:hypothetical protein
MRVQTQSWGMPNVFNVGNVVKQLIWTRVTVGGPGVRPHRAVSTQLILD